MSSGFRSLLCALGLVATLAGCGGGVNTITINAKSKSNDVAINDPGLQSDVEIVAGKALYNEQLMQIVVDLQSHSNGSLKVYVWKTNWFDSDGFPLPEESWHFLPLMGNEHKLVTSSASAPRAEKCEFMLRRRSKDDREN